MNPEQRVVLTGVKLVVECEIILVGEVSRLARPCRFGDVDDIVAVGGLHLAVLPFHLLAGNYGHREEAAVFLEQRVDARLLEEFAVVVVDVEDDFRAALLLVARFYGELRRAVALPAHGLGAFLIAEGIDFNLFGHHECRVESEAEMADDGVCVVLVFFQEFLGTRECYLVDVFLDVVGGHADAMVGHGKCACLLVDSNLHTHIVERALEVAESGESFQFLGRVDGIGYQFAQKDFVIAVEKFF